MEHWVPTQYLRVWTGCAVGLLASSLLADNRPPTFPSDTQVVLLDLVVRENGGRPVEDLRQDEVQVLEEGTRCEIASFRLVRAPGRADSAAPAQAAPAQEPPGSTAEAATPSRANLVILVFDTLPVATAPLARQGALDLLSREFPANTWFAVFKIDRGMRLLQAFTSDPARLASAVDFATTGDGARRADSAGSLQSVTLAPATTAAEERSARRDSPPSPVLAKIGERVQGYLSELATRVQTFDSLYGLLAVARSLEAVRGRKSIVYFAEGREIMVPDDVTNTYDTTISEANRANVTIHTVDTRGLSSRRLGGRSAFDEVLRGFRAESATSAEGQDGRTVRPPRAATPEGAPAAGGRLSGSMLADIANDTGGLAIADTNDLGLGLGRVVEELGQYYEVVYVPPNPVRDGRFRRIEARVSRPGVRVRTRSGYFATPAAAPGLLAYEMPLLAALGERAPSHDFAYHAGVLHFGAKDLEREAVFLAQVPLSGVRFTADEARGLYRVHLTLLTLVKDEAGRPVARLSHDWPIEGPLVERDRVRRASAVFRRSMTLPPGHYTLETAVQDRETGALSVERSAFAIAEAPPGGLALGSLSIVRRAEPAEAGAPEDPLRVAGVSIHPELGTPVLPRSTQEIPLFLLVYPTFTAGGAELRLDLLRDGQPVAQAQPPLPAPEPDGRIAWIGGLPSKSLAPGRYEIVATVRLGDESAEERTAFEIGDGTSASAPTAAPAPVPSDLVPILEQAARYVLDYEQAFHDIAAEESCTQWTEPQPRTVAGLTLSCVATGCRRTTRADVVFVRLGGAVPWGTFRDVFEVDGQKVRDREGRLEALFTASSRAGVVERARAILNESARYNIGPAVRNINFPTLSLLFLHPRNQHRFAWKSGGTRRFGTVEGLQVDFEETARPTLVDQDGQGDLPAKGRFWIDPRRGTVLRSETHFQFETAWGRASVATDYRQEPRLAMWVPSEMREEYDFGFPGQATARYSNFRKFTVTIEDEAARLPPEL